MSTIFSQDAEELVHPNHPLAFVPKFSCALWTFKQQLALALKMRARCGISIGILKTILYCDFRDTPTEVNDSSWE